MTRLRRRARTAARLAAVLVLAWLTASAAVVGAVALWASREVERP